MAKKPDHDTYTEEETPRRFEAALRGARIAGPKPMKDVPRKRAESKADQPKANLKKVKSRRARVAVAKAKPAK